jgi:Ribonuclease G/E
VVRVVQGLDAALVDIGDERSGFLPLRDAPDTKLEEGIRVLVQVRREAWQDKAPRLSAKIAASDLPALADCAARLDPPAQLFPAVGLAAALALRLPRTPERIVADDTAILAELRAAFRDADIAHQNPADWPLDLDAAFDLAIAPSIALPSGGAVHFAETRAATLIDVDTGTPETGTAERAALAANRAAAVLIARQLRLRNIGGPVVVDFVGLDRRDQRERLRAAFETTLLADPAKPQLLGWTRLGHLELVRPRRGRSLADALLEPSSTTKHPFALAHEALRLVLREARANPAANWRLTVASDIETALRGPAAAALRALETRLGRRIAIDAAPGRAGFDIRPI